MNWLKRLNPTFILFFIIAFLLRSKSFGFGLPYLYHADEPIIVNHALAYGTGDLNPHFFKIPPLVSYLLFFCYGIFYLTLKFLGQLASPHDFELLFYSNPTWFYLVARMIFGVLLGSLSVALFYSRLKHFFCSKVIILAATFFSFAFIHVRDSHYLYADIPLVFVMILTLSYFCRVIQSDQQTLMMHVISGLLIGLATAVKYNGIALSIPYAIILLQIAKISFRQLIIASTLTATATFIMYILLNPFTWFDWHTFLNEISLQSKSQGGVGWLHHCSYSLWQGIGPCMLLLSSVGLVSTFRSSHCSRIISIFIISYYGILAIAGQPYDRYILPLVPWLCLFSAEGINTLSKTIRNRPIRFCLTTVLVLFVLIPNFVKSLKFNSVMSKTDTRTLSKLWIEENIPSNARIALDWDFYMPRLSFSPQQLNNKIQKLSSIASASAAQKNRLQYLLGNQTLGYELFFLSHSGFNSQSRFLFAEPTVPFDLEELRKMGIQYVITGSFSHTDNKDWLQFQKELQDQGKLIQTFTPYRSLTIQEVLDPIPLTGGPFTWADLLNRERNGPVIRIYQIS